MLDLATSRQSDCFASCKKIQTQILKYKKLKKFTERCYTAKIQTQILKYTNLKKFTEIDLCCTAILRPLANVAKYAGVFCNFDDIALINILFVCL